MSRILHRWAGLPVVLIVAVLTLSGAALSVFPAAERLSAPKADAALSVADLAGRVTENFPGVEQIKRAPSGKITAYWFDGGTPGAAVIDPATGAAAGAADANPVERWLTELHRSLFLDDSGRLVQIAGAAAMLALVISGAFLVARRTGGWRRWFTRLNGPLAGRLHVELARVAVGALALSSVTALWMAATTFGLLPAEGQVPGSPTTVSGQTGMAPAQMTTLRDTAVVDLRELTFPYPGDASDVFTLKTHQGTGYLDQGTGALLAWAEPGTWERAFETIYMLHTGQGAATLGLVLGLLALTVPAMAATGVLIWLSGRGNRPHLRGAVAADRAETVILVGSEGGSTWGFATTLGSALIEQKQSVHVAAMSSFAPERYARARRIVLFAATYGDGDAPASAKGFIDRLTEAPARRDVHLAVLGFGDRSFPAFCAFADDVTTVAGMRGWSFLMPTDRVDRQSSQDFSRWGLAFGATMGLQLQLVHHRVVPRTTDLRLVSRRTYGEAVGAPMAILRFEAPQSGLLARMTGRAFPAYSPGDLLGILPEGSPVPRFYSLASARRDGFLEIAVRQHPGGLCSGQLMALQPGDTVQAFVRENPGFQPDSRFAPLILIGAGTGIGPLAGFIRANAARRPIHLWFGARHPEGDLLYGQDLVEWRGDGRLSGLRTAFSRTAAKAYVQDALRQDAEMVRDLIHKGARIMVCGGRDMAQGVRSALDDILAPVGLTPAGLKAEGRYAEDVY